MNLFLSHIDWSPILYGVALFLSIMSMGWKIKRENYTGFAIELCVVAIILLVHGGSVTGGFAATIAGLLSGWFIPLIFPHPMSESHSRQASPAPVVKPTFTPYELYQLTRKR